MAHSLAVACSEHGTTLRKLVKFSKHRTTLCELVRSANHASRAMLRITSCLWDYHIEVTIRLSNVLLTGLSITAVIPMLSVYRSTEFRCCQGQDPKGQYTRESKVPYQTCALDPWDRIDSNISGAPQPKPKYFKFL